LIMMTDGEDNDGTGQHQESAWDSAVVTAAGTLAHGPSLSDPSDDVDIYVINFQCGLGATYNNGCTSKLADTAVGTNHLCPGTLPNAASMSNTDTVLVGVSSSTVGTCDHYFPLRKDEDLPALFLQLAGTISRGALTD
jgi:hypothetical protein